MKYYQICIEGIDKTGKDVLHDMLDSVCNHLLSINVRGLMSNMVYDKIYNRTDRHYDLSAYKNVITIKLNVEKEDWLIRCKATREKDVKPSDYEYHSQVFNEIAAHFRDNGLLVLEYNTTLQTPYQIATSIMEQINRINKDSK